MKTTHLLVCVTVNLFMVLNVSISPLFAKAPMTSKILFTSVRDGNYEIYVMNPDGSEEVNLTQHPANDQQAAWSPTGEQILFVSDRNGEVDDLYLMNADGSNVRRVFNEKRRRRRNKSSPTWSPDGSQFAYGAVGWNSSMSTIYIATLGKEKEKEFVIGGTDPAWSPDGTEIACIIDERLTFVNLHTQSQTRFLPHKAIQWQSDPSWSATGDKLVFSGNNHPFPAAEDRHLHNEWIDKNTIFIVNSDGTGLHQLVDEAGRYAWAPELSPDGRYVLYTRPINGQHEILKIDVRSGIQTQLTHKTWNFGGDWFNPMYALPVSPEQHFLTATWGEVKR